MTRGAVDATIKAEVISRYAVRACSFDISERGRLMRFKCRQELFVNSLQTAIKAISGKATLPILEGALLEAYDGSLKITCTDLNMGIITQLEADIAEEGRVVLPGKLLGEIVRKLPDGEEDVSVAANNATTLRCRGSRTTLAGFAAEEYPPLPALEENETVTLPQSELRDMIRQTSFSIATEESRPIFTGCLMEVSPERVNLVALDGFRLALRTLEPENCRSTFDALIPGKSLNEVARILGDEGDAILRLDRTHMSFEIGGTRVITRMLEGEFIKYRSIIPATWSSMVRVSRRELAECIDRASLLAKDGKNNLMKFTVSDSRLVITSNSEMGDAYEELEAMHTGDDLEISFNIRFMSDIMKAIEDEDVVLRFNSAVSPCVICPVEGERYTYLVLPVRSA